MVKLGFSFEALSVQRLSMGRQGLVYYVWVGVYILVQWIKWKELGIWEEGWLVLGVVIQCFRDFIGFGYLDVQGVEGRSYRLFLNFFGQRVDDFGIGIGQFFIGQGFREIFFLGLGRGLYLYYNLV